MALAPRTAVGEAIFTSLQGITSVAPSPDRTPPARVVLLSDGETTTGRPDEAAAQAASEANVSVSTIALGTESGTVRVEGREIPVPVNREALRRIAESTKGTFYEASSAEELNRAYDDARRAMLDRAERLGVTPSSLALATLLAATSGGLVWFIGRRRRGITAAPPESASDPIR